MAKETKKIFRSSEWFGPTDKGGFIHRSWTKNEGLPDHLFDGRPVIGICNTWSELTPCNAHLRRIAEHVKRGIYEAGGFPLEFPVTSLGENLMRPTAMLFRNLASMDVEETIRANPVDGVVLLVGCDKTTPACLMGAASCDLPTLAVSGGPMLNGKFRGEEIGSGTNVWKFSEDVRSGAMPLCDFLEAESCMSRSAGHCMTMGTASTMASMVEALGIGMPMNAAIPAADSRRYALAHLAGCRIVEMVHEDLRMSKILTRKAFENAVRVAGAIGGSTNAVVHLLAIAGRLGIDFKLEDWDELGRNVPCLVNLMPSGKYLMEDFYYAGGLPAVIRELGDLIHQDALTVNGRTVGENTANAPCYNRNVIKPFDEPLTAKGGIAVLRGNLCPAGAVIKPSNCGPKGYPGMAEVGNMPLPPKLLKKGITDMVRISDARMSGTAYGTVVLHVAPESAAGGPLALVENGDHIELDVDARKLHLDVSDEELALRRAKWQPPQSPYNRGYYKLYIDHVLQADRGADFDFLVGHSGTAVIRESH
jgi:L-arabonate dehydrase